jgi:hypothetical protein
MTQSRGVEHLTIDQDESLNPAVAQH